MEPIPATWLDAVAKLGFPAVLLLAGLYLAWRFGKSFHATVVVPVVSAHVNFLKDQTDISRRMAGAIEQQSDTLNSLKESQADMSRSMRLLAEMQHRTRSEEAT